MEVPCGQCLQCRISKRREWSVRILQERGYYEKSLFLTLTYSDENLPYNEGALLPTLRKRDLQLFIKRLRKILGSERRIRYFACGEYGEETQRPHYHLIIFNLGFDDRELIKNCWPYADWSVPAINQKSFGLAESDSIRYVAQYIDKKYNGKLAYNEYEKLNREPVFKISSLGIGRQYADDHKKQFVENKCMIVRGIKMSIPRYYAKRLDLDPKLFEEYAIIKESELVAMYTGLHTTVEGFRNTQNTPDFVELTGKLKKMRKQNNKNLQAKQNLAMLKKMKKI